MPVTKQHSIGGNFWERVGISVDGDALVNHIRAGFDYRVFEAALMLFGLSRREAGNALDIPRTTLERRARNGRLTTQESDRLYRMIEVLGTAVAVFEGDNGNMLLWMRSPIIALGNRRPIDLMATSAESQMVLSVLRKIEHGDFS